MFNPYIDTDTAVDLYVWTNRTFKDISGFSKELIIDCDLFLQFVNRLNYIPPYEIVNSSVNRVFPNLSGYKMTIINRGVVIEAIIREDTLLSNKVILTKQFNRNTHFDELVQKLCCAINLVVTENYNFRLLKQFIDESNETFIKTVSDLLSVTFFNFIGSDNSASGCFINKKRFSMFVDRKACEDTALGIYIAYDGMSVISLNFENSEYREF